MWLAVVLTLCTAAAPVKPLRAPRSEQHASVDLLDEDTMGTNACLKKRVDRCGCHRIFGRRHCHPNRRTEACEAYAENSRPSHFERKMPASPSGSLPAVSRRTIAIDSRLISETTSAFVDATQALFPSGEISSPTGAGLFPIDANNRLSEPDTAS